MHKLRPNIGLEDNQGSETFDGVVVSEPGGNSYSTLSEYLFIGKPKIQNILNMVNTKIFGCEVEWAFFLNG